MNATSTRTRRSLATRLEDYSATTGAHFDTHTENGLIGYYLDGVKLTRDQILFFMDNDRLPA